MPRYASEIGSSESGSRFSVSKVANLLLQGLRFFSSSLQTKHQHVWLICTSQHMLESTLCLYTWRSNTAMHVEIILLVFVYLTNTIWVDPSTWTFEDHNEKSSQRWEIYQVSHALYTVQCASNVDFWRWRLWQRVDWRSHCALPLEHKTFKKTAAERLWLIKGSPRLIGD